MTQISGVVGAPSSTSVADGTATQAMLQGKSGELLDAKLHGDFYTAAYRGRAFIGATAMAGTTIPVNASNLVGTFVLWNPAGSGVNLEVISYELGIAGTTTAVIGSLALVFQAGIGSAIVIPTSQTALTPVAALVGSNSAPQGRLLSAGTLTGTPTVLMSLGISFGTTGATPGPVSNSFNFNGRLILPPGVLVTTVCTAAQTQAMQQQFTWAEWPI